MRNFSVIGVDEAGRGPWAGPVVAAAAWYESGLETHEIFSRLRDSKRLAEHTREYLFEALSHLRKTGIVHWETGISDVQTIDDFGIREATRRAMETAIQALVSYQKTGLKAKCIIDGRDNFSFDIPKIAPTFLVRADAIIPSVMLASIIAKVVRDRMMRQFHDTYPDYGFAWHKWYGTRLHAEMLQRYGPCPLHRRSFRPVRDLLFWKNFLPW